MSNQTIDSIPRELLMSAANRLSDMGQAHISEPLFAILNAHSKDLRALLDAKTCCLCGKPTVCGKVTCEYCAYEMPAAYPQGESVINLDLVDWETIQKAADEYRAWEETAETFEDFYRKTELELDRAVIIIKKWKEMFGESISRGSDIYKETDSFLEEIK